MADSIFCRFVDFRTHCNFNLLLPSKHFQASLFHSSNSRIRIVRRKPLHLTLLSNPSSPDIDVISTHEHSDGSVLFRFGDPSEISKNVKIEETETVNEEREQEQDIDGYSVVKVLDGDNERSVLVKTAVGTVSTQEADDESSPTVTNATSVGVIERENEPSEKSMEASMVVELESPIYDSSIEVEVPDGVGEFLKEEHEDSCPATESTIAESLKVENDIDAVESPLYDPSMEVEAPNGGGEFLKEDHEDEDSSPATESIVDESLKVENDIDDVESTEIEVLDITTAPDDNVLPSRQETIAAADGHADSENQALGDEMSSKATEDGAGNVVSELLSPSVPLEPAMSLLENVEDEDRNFTVANGSGSDENDALITLTETESNVVLSIDAEAEASATETERPPLEPAMSLSENIEDEDRNFTVANGSLSDENDALVTSTATVADVTLSIDAEAEASATETERPNETFEDGTQNDKIAPVHVSPQSESDLVLDEKTGDDNAEETGEEEDESLVMSEDTEPVVSLSERTEIQKSQTVIQNVMVAKDSDSSENDILVAPLTEAAMSSLTDADYQTSSLIEVIEDGDETDADQLALVSSQLEAEQIAHDETSKGSVVESMAGDDEPPSVTMLNDIPQELNLGSEKAEDYDVQSTDLIQVSRPELEEFEPTKSAISSNKIQRTRFLLSSGAALLPHPSKVLAGGEDAHFVAGQKWLGVADGVGQWSLEGTDPGVYAQELLKNCEKLVSNGEPDSVNNPVELLNLSIAETHSPGSSTVLIAQFDGQTLHVANIGDSGIILLREGAVYKRSSPMFHLFHFPKQIKRGDDPSQLAELYKIDVEENDVFVTATDGLLDNLYDQEILSIVSNSLAADKTPKEIAEILATKAQEVGRSATGRTPFADSAQAAGYGGYTGGKLDDVAIIVSVVQRQSNS